MRIGIITVHDSANYGSFLQAYALMLALTDMKHDVYFIKTRSEKEAKKVFMGAKRDIKNYVKRYKKNKEKYSKFLNDRKKFKEIEMKDVSKDTLDCIVYGSDELWNICTPVFRRGYFYGENIDVENKIVYAISSGQASYEQFEEFPNLENDIRKLKTIFVRDNRTQGLLKQITGIEYQKVCDPTFLVDVSRLMCEYEVPIQQKYILVYAYNVSENMKSHIVKYAKENGCIIVAACMQHEWCDINIMCSPLEFSGLITKAEAVITSTFHGTIFSFLNRSKFVSCANLNKVKEILEVVGLEDSMIVDDCSYEDFLLNINKEKDFDRVHEIISCLRKDSLALLQSALEEEQ